MRAVNQFFTKTPYGESLCFGGGLLYGVPSFAEVSGVPISSITFNQHVHSGNIKVKRTTLLDHELLFGLQPACLYRFPYNTFNRCLPSEFQKTAVRAEPRPYFNLSCRESKGLGATLATSMRGGLDPTRSRAVFVSARIRSRHVKFLSAFFTDICNLFSTAEIRAEDYRPITEANERERLVARLTNSWWLMVVTVAVAPNRTKSSSPWLFRLSIIQEKLSAAVFAFFSDRWFVSAHLRAEYACLKALGDGKINATLPTCLSNGMPEFGRIRITRQWHNLRCSIRVAFGAFDTYATRSLYTTARRSA